MEWDAESKCSKLDCFASQTCRPTSSFPMLHHQRVRGVGDARCASGIRVLDKCPKDVDDSHCTGASLALSIEGYAIQIQPCKASKGSTRRKDGGVQGIDPFPVVSSQCFLVSSHGRAS